VHCDKGNHRTGCVIGCLRKLQGWALTSIFDELTNYQLNKERRKRGRGGEEMKSITGKEE
jgi:protein tyrosine/serine phosphatase